MGIFTVLLVGGAVYGAARLLKKDRDNERLRTAESGTVFDRESFDCSFDEVLTEQRFAALAESNAKVFRKIESVYTTGAIVHAEFKQRGEICHFTIDFNDYGRISGRYWLNIPGPESQLPRELADRMAQEIRELPGRR